MQVLSFAKADVSKVRLPMDLRFNNVVVYHFLLYVCDLSKVGILSRLDLYSPPGSRSMVTYLPT